MMPASANFLLLILCLGLLTCSLNAQDDRRIQGVVTSNDEGVPGVFIENLASGQRITTNDEGTFTIRARSADSLVVAHPDHKFFILVLGESDFVDDLLEIDLNQMSIELDAVLIQDVSHINAYDLGLIDHQMEVPTTYERRLHTAGDFKMIHLLSILGGSLQIDPIINKISGRTKRMKRNIEIEGRIQNLDFLKENYSSYITASLNIEGAELNRFFYYLVEETDIAALIQENHDAQLKFFIQDFWIRYQELKRE